jgi:hypothetical protein
MSGREPQLLLNYGGGRSRGGAQLNQHKGKEGEAIQIYLLGGEEGRGWVACVAAVAAVPLCMLELCLQVHVFASIQPTNPIQPRTKPKPTKASACWSSRGLTPSPTTAKS